MLRASPHLATLHFSLHWRGCVAFAFLLAIVLLGPVLAAAEQPEDPPTWQTTAEPAQQRYNGTYLGAGGGASLGFVDGTAGAGIEAYTRLGLIINVLDVVLRYRFARFALPEAGSEPHRTLLRHGLVGAFRVHPLFVRMTGQRYIDYTMSAIFLELGAGVDFDAWGGPQADSQVQAAIHLGGGIDLPIGIPDGPSSWWVGFRYGRSWGLPPPGGLNGSERFHEHAITVTFDWRWHNLRFARVARPAALELDR